MQHPNSDSPDVLYHAYLILLGATAVLLGLSVLIPSWTFLVLGSVTFAVFAALTAGDLADAGAYPGLKEPVLVRVVREAAGGGLYRAFMNTKYEADLRPRPWLRLLSWIIWPLWLVLGVHRQMQRIQAGRLWAAWYAIGRFLTLIAAWWFTGMALVSILTNLVDDSSFNPIDFRFGWLVGLVVFIVLCGLAIAACDNGRLLEISGRKMWQQNLLRHERTVPVERYLAGEIGQRVALGWRAEGVVLSDPESQVLLLGPSRVGKTTGVILPSVCGWDGPVLATSTKTDLFDKTVLKRLEHDGRVLLFDPTGKTPLPSLGQTGMVERFLWSPLDGAENYDTARLTATAMIGALPPDRTGTYFRDRASQLLGALLHVAALGVDEHDRLDTLLRWESSYSCDTALQIAHQLNQDKHPNLAAGAYEILIGVAETAKREASGYWSNVARALDGCGTSGYRGQYAQRVALDVASLVAVTRSRTTIYIVAPSDAQASMAPIVVGFIEALRSAIYAAWRDAGLPVLTGDLRGPLRPWLFALDELANIAPLPDLPALLSEGASQGIVVLAALQDLSQARVRYEEAASGLLSLFGTTVVYPGIRDSQTLELVSLLYGEHEVKMRSSTSSAVQRPSREFTPSITESTQWRRAVLPAEISAPKTPHHLRVLLPGGRPPIEMLSDQLFHEKLNKEQGRGTATEEDDDWDDDDEEDAA